jgi:hypothetical protein
MEQILMTDIPMKASVVCSDGPCGQSTNVIVNPVNHKVTHFALHDKNLPNNPTRLVPAGMVADVTPQQVRLTCSKADVAEMPPFIVTNFIAQSAPGYAYATGEAYHSQYVINDTGYDAVKEPAIPAGEVEVHSGMHVQATDGKVGKLDALVLDPTAGRSPISCCAKGIYGARRTWPSRWRASSTATASLFLSRWTRRPLGPCPPWQ